MLQDITCEGKKEANKIFGNTNLREEHGLTYNVGINNEAYSKSGIFCILTSVDSDRDDGEILMNLSSLQDMLEDVFI